MQVTPDGMKMVSRSEVLRELRENPDAEIYHGRSGERLWIDSDRRLRQGDAPGKLVSAKEPVPVAG